MAIGRGSPREADGDENKDEIGADLSKTCQTNYLHLKKHPMLPLTKSLSSKTNAAATACTNAHYLIG